MRLRLLCLFCLSGLTGCAYYGDIHGNSQPVTVASLDTSLTYTVPVEQPRVARVNWWDRFHDPQLDQLITLALADSPNILIAEARVRRAQHLVEGAVAPMWPTINLSGSLQRQRFSEYGLVPPPFNGKTFNIGEIGLNFNYEFDFWGKNRQTLAARVSEKCAAEADLAQARLIISTAVANTYFQLLSNISQLEIAKKNWRQSREISKIIVERSSHGIDSDIPVKTALADEQAAHLMVEQFKQAEKLSRNQLAALLGDNPFTTKIETHRFVYRKHHVRLPELLTANLLASRPDISAAKLRAQAAADEIKVAKAGFFPDISLSGLFSYQSIKIGKLFNPANQNNAITGAIDLPIFDAGARRANLGVKYAEYDIAVNEYNETILNALREVADQKATLEELNAQISTQNTALRATSHNYKLYSERYRHGIIDYVPVLEIRQLLLQQEATQLDLQTRQLQTVVAMMKALGGPA